MVDLSPVEVSEYSHADMPLMIAEDGEDLDYEYVFYRNPEYCVREYGCPINLIGNLKNVFNLLNEKSLTLKKEI